MQPSPFRSEPAGSSTLGPMCISVTVEIVSSEASRKNVALSHSVVEERLLMERELPKLSFKILILARSPGHSYKTCGMCQTSKLTLSPCRRSKRTDSSSTASIKQSTETARLLPCAPRSLDYISWSITREISAFQWC